ncbi:TPA: pneumococcal surface protein PspC, choline-binding form, partial [Streptococcus pneumoniae]|nr:pneumococcal surface protein PspC, choline-binding form [Streptococcus pneumoniae]
MFASKSERKVHYSIRKFSIGVASVAVASLFLGGVVHAEGVGGRNTPIPQTVSSGGKSTPKASPRNDGVQGDDSSAEQGEQHRGINLERDKAKKAVNEYLEKILSEIKTQLDRKRHDDTVALIKKLLDIKRTYLYKLDVDGLTTKELIVKSVLETQAELDVAFKQFKKDTLKPGEKVAEAQKKVEEAEKKAKDQKEEDRRNYPTNTYKTLELEIAESDVEVKKAELELLKEEAKESRDEGTIKQAEAKVESKKAEATKLEKIKTDREKAEEEAKRKADAKLKEAVEKNAANSEQGEPKRRVKRGVLGEPATPDKKENDAKSSDSSVGEETLPSPSLKPEKKVAEAEKKVAEAEKKAKDQKEEDRRNYPTNTYKTLELEIAESDVKVKEAELELVNEEAKPRNEEKIKKAKAKVESKKAEATRLEKIKTDRKKAEEEAKRKAAEEDKVKEKPAEQPQPAPAPQPEKPAEETPAPAPKPEKPAEQPKAEKPADQQAEEDYARRSEEEYNRLTQQQPPKPEQPAPAPKIGWKQENGMWYFYNTDGSMATGWLQNNGSWYYLNANGDMAT